MSERSARDSLLGFLDELAISEAGDDVAVSDPYGDDDSNGGAVDLDRSVFGEVKEKMLLLQLRLSESERDLALTREALGDRDTRLTQSLAQVRAEGAGRLARQKG